MHGKTISIVLGLTLAGGLRGAAPPDPPAAPACPGAAPCSGSLPALCQCTAPSDTGHYIGYYVGGGVPFFGQPRCANEGTWGWDYSGCWFQRWVTLLWSHGNRYQGGTGAYKLEGPKLLHPHPEKHEGAH